ncbi:MAG: DNA repair protein RadA, partial [Actinomycetota bacterium]
MAKLRLVYRCTECTGSFPKWAGKCVSCGAWNSLVEDVEGPEPQLASLAV